MTLFAAVLSIHKSAVASTAGAPAARRVDRKAATGGSVKQCGSLMMYIDTQAVAARG